MASKGKEPSYLRCSPCRDGEPQVRSGLEPEACPEHPDHRGEANRKEDARHDDTYANDDVRDAEEAPAEGADEVDDWVEKRHRLPGRRQHGDGVEAATEKSERRHDQRRNDLQLIPAC